MVNRNVATTLGRTKQLVPTVSFAGDSGSGKTTLLERVVRELKRLGYKVAVVKHTPHGFDLDRPGKDSWRFTHAGSDVVILSSPESVSLVKRVDTEMGLAQIQALVGDEVDIILVEGYKTSNMPRIVVSDGEFDRQYLWGNGELVASVSPHRSASGTLQFHTEDIARIVNLLVGKINVPLAGFM